MTDEELDRLLDILLEQRARIDVLEKTLAMFAASSNRTLAMAVEDQLRSYIELGVTSADPGIAARLKRADEAAVRLADHFAQALATRGS